MDSRIQLDLMLRDAGDLYDLAPADEAMVRAEMLGGDYGVFVRARCSGAVPERIDQAIDRLLDSWPTLTARLVRDGGRFAVRRTRGVRHDDVRSATTLAGSTLLAARGGALFGYHVDRDAGTLELLVHHLVTDGDALPALLGDLDAVLAGGSTPAPGEWPWQASSAPGRPAGDPSGAAGGPSTGGDDRGSGLGAALSPKRSPRPGTHVLLRLDEGFAARLARAAAAARVTPFALFLAAAARIGTGQVTTVVSRRWNDAAPRRAGNATELLTVDVADLGGGPFARQVHERFALTWAGRHPQPPRDASTLVLSLSEASPDPGYTQLRDVELGPYVVKYPRHIQLQTVDGGYLLEVYAEPACSELAAAFRRALDELIAGCLDATASGPRPGPDLPPVKAAPAADGRPVPGAAPSLVRRILAAPDGTALRELGIGSLDVLGLLCELAEEYGLRASAETFYSWDSVDDVRAFLDSRPAAGGEPVEGPSAALPLPHLTDIFMDAFRYRDRDLYPVEYAFLLDPALSADADEVAAAVLAVLRRHEAFGAALEFRDGAVVAVPGRREPSVRRGTCTDLEQLRFAGELAVASPQYLWDAAVMEVDGAGVALYLLAHHLLLDHLGLQVFLADVVATLRDPAGSAARRRPQWADVAAQYAAARTRAVQVWAELPPPDGLTTVGRPGFTAGTHRTRRFPWNAADPHGPLADVLAVVTRLVGGITGTRRGVIGSVHHGRTVPGAEAVVGSFARVLPLHFDLDRPQVLLDSVHRLLGGQSCTVRDLPQRVPLPFPVVFQLLRVPAGAPDGVARSLEYPGATKFGLLLDLLVSADRADLEVTVASDLYPGEETERIFALAAAAVARGGREVRP